MDILYFLDDLNNAENSFYVKFKANVIWKNDSQWYEYGGARFYDHQSDYPVVPNHPTWEETDYSDEENEIIRKFMEDEDNVDKIINLIEIEASKHENRKYRN